MLSSSFHKFPLLFALCSRAAVVTFPSASAFVTTFPGQLQKPWNKQCMQRNGINMAAADALAVKELGPLAMQIDWEKATETGKFRVSYGPVGEDGENAQLTNWFYTNEQCVKIDQLAGGTRYFVQVEPVGEVSAVLSSHFQTKEEYRSAPGDRMEAVSQLEMRVGQIIEIEKHPKADSLYVETVDLGPDHGTRTIVSGLVKYCTEEELRGSKVVVLCNLKPRNMRGIDSAGMLLCASSEGKGEVDPLRPPEDAELGELIRVEGFAANPLPTGMRANSAYFKISERFHTDDNGIATYLNAPIKVLSGPISSEIKSGRIS